MHRIWSIATLCSLTLILQVHAQEAGSQPVTPPPVPATQDADSSATQGIGPAEEQDADQSKVITKKVALPAPKLDTMQGVRPLAGLAEALESNRLAVPAEASVADTIRYLHDLTNLREELASDYRNILTRITQAQGEAAERLLEDADALSDQDFYLVASLGLSARISRIPYGTPEAQQRTYELVLRQLEIGVSQGLKLDEIRNATRTASYLERHGDRSLALTASAKLTGILRTANNPRYQDTIESLEDLSRRLELVGKPFELTGNTVDGRSLRWSQYKGKVVLVHFWASWSVPCLAELAQLRRYYEDYHRLGFEIVGVCLDANRVELESVIAKEQIPWPNLFETGKGSDHPMAVKYGVRAVPSAFLINEEGIVVSTQARGFDLERSLQREFGPASSMARDLAVESKWSEVAAELQRLVVLYPNRIDYRLALGAVQLHADDPLGYAGTCQASLPIFLQEDSPDRARAVPLFCLSSESSLPADEVYEIAQSVRADSDTNPARLAIILSAFRSGRMEECLKEELEDGDDFSVAVAALAKGMAARRLDQDAQTDLFLTRARRIVRQRLNDLLGSASPDLPYEHWICCIVAKQLLSEAETVLARD